METISKQLEKIASEICDKFCKYPDQPIPEGKEPDWLITDPESPCNNCPLMKI